MTTITLTSMVKAESQPAAHVCGAPLGMRNPAEAVSFVQEDRIGRAPFPRTLSVD